MKESSVTNFGLLIAFMLPGFVALWGVSYVAEPVQSWLGASPADAPTVGGFLYVTLASIAAGLTVSTVRWMVIDTLHHATGLARPAWDFSLLQQHVAAFDVLVEFHYRYYLFYGNMAVAVVFTSLIRHFAAPGGPIFLDTTDAAAMMLTLVFLAGSRDTLSKYYRRGGQLLVRNRSH